VGDKTEPLVQLTCSQEEALDKLGKAELLVKSVFELRSASIAGYTPDLFGCHICGSQECVLFDISGGALLCDKCKGTAEGIRLPVTPAILEAMRYITYCDARKLFSFSLGEDALQQLSSVTEAYLTTQLERGFSTLDFYKSLLI
jgi:DNA repair protein RecO (recombination protein O)